MKQQAKRLGFINKLWFMYMTMKLSMMCLIFRDTEQGVAEWCMENLDEDHEYYEAIMEAYEDEDWELVIKLEGCRHCEYEYDYEWVVEEIEETQNA
jgi:hypothetical protein